MLLRTFALASLFAASAAFAGPGVIFAPVSGTVDTSGPGFGTLDDTINEAGLLSTYVNDVTNFDDYIATNPLHTSEFLGNEYFSNPGVSTMQVTYDFGTSRTFNALALWNEELSGIGMLNLLVSSEGISFHPLATGLLPSDNPPFPAPYGADVFAFATTTARYVRFEASGCPQPNAPVVFQACAIGEVAFRYATASATPEPACWAMLIAGFGLAGAAMRRRRQELAA